ncbi:MocR-like pyridoxine biosynthesis transcription factor PdxR [Corallococcus terminator]|uniref:PLP-dependent aminotransferase family protein n=1 Tax=Corallococcus terminator TaxID=2316733 RepID=A0A3A8IU25_9BACT|nr:PLP-dependent aminotransferase family protein [Corallococcus terminator]RKG86248.1 PLP-dependent aminotransferase family protein [Corallococcus terminator]
MDFHVDLQDRRDLSGTIYRELRAAILDGRLRRGERLPPTRELALRLDVSRNTVSLAYEWLTAEGLLEARTRAGSFVQGEPLPREARKGQASRVRLRARAFWREQPDPPERRPPTGHGFDVGVPDARHFPFDMWRRLVARQLRAAALPGGYAEAVGHRGLREAVVRHVGVARGVHADVEDVLITNGAQQAIDLVGRVLIEPGDCVAVEEPGYPPARQVFHSLGARVVPVPVDAEGLDVRALPDSARLVYVTPSHQFPLGMPLSPARRGALLEWARQRDAVIVEDDYDSEFRFGGRPLETLHGLDRSGRVLYVGSFSKVLLPGLRMGFLIAPPSLQRELRLARRVMDWHGPFAEQAALARFIDGGMFARHIRKLRREYAERHARVEEGLARHCADWLEVVPSLAGLHLCATFRRGGLKLERETVARARAADVGLVTLSRYYAGPRARPGLVLGYGALPTARIPEATRRLGACLAKAAGGN